MGEGDRVETAADPLAGVDWAQVYLRALIIARTRFREQDIDDVVGEGVKRVLEGKAPWDEAKGRTLAEHVVQIGANARRVEVRKSGRRTSEGFLEQLGSKLAEREPPDPEEHALSADRRAKLFRGLVADFAGDPEALAVLECEERRIDQAAEQAVATGLGIEAVRNARKRLKRRIEALARGGEP
jgi:hypothetical protein